MVMEWEFPVPSDKVDLERICTEINGVSTVFALAYMESLKKQAPIVFNRLKVWGEKNNKLKWYNWSEK